MSETLDDRRNDDDEFWIEIYDPAAGEIFFCFASSYKENNLYVFLLLSHVPSNRNKSCWSFIICTQKRRRWEQKRKIVFFFWFRQCENISRKSAILIAMRRAPASFLGANWGLSAESWSRRSLMDAEQIEERLNRWSERSTVKDRVKIAAARARFMLCKIKLLLSPLFHGHSTLAATTDSTKWFS